MRAAFHPINLAVILVMAVMFIGATSDEESVQQDTAVVIEATPLPTEPAPLPPAGEGGAGQTAVVDEPAIISPYINYFITQGHHGHSYGHLAIDLSAGKGAEIVAPLSGEVTELYTDEWGNPTLVIASERYEVMMLHGDYTVAIGDRVRQGELIGYESNKGYVTDLNGNRCINGRECGYHTHLNVYDKQLQANVDPFRWIAYRDWDQFLAGQ